MQIRIGDKTIGKQVFIVAEIGINHNGDINIAKKLIDVAKDCGCDAVKFQKRTPEECVPPEYKNVMRETPWGLITYLQYRKKIEFGKEEYDIIADYCKRKGIAWGVSCWDLPSLEFIQAYQIDFLKVPSALITHKKYLEKIKSLKGKYPIFVSTGMSDLKIVDKVVKYLGEDNLVILHTVSAYPASPEDINLRVISLFKNRYRCPIGYSGHEVGLQITLAAVALGACVIERHITLDRSMWGTDQAASVEPQGLQRLVRDVRIIERALGTEEKTIKKSEISAIKKLRRVNDI